MYVPKEKIVALIEYYGNSKKYPTKSHLKKFAEDNELNYNQWQAYATGTQNAGIKILGALIEIFPNINLNWLFKDDYNMFTLEPVLQMVQEPKKKVDLDMIWEKLVEVQADIKNIVVKM